MILRTSAGDPSNLTGTVRVGANNYTYTISIPLVGDLDGDGIYDLLDPTPRGETPVFTSSNRVVGGVGNSLAHTLTIRGYTNFSMFTFTAEPLPDGVSIDGNVISGTPTTVGTTTVALSAANPFGSVGRTNLILTILPGFTSSTAVQGLVNDASFRHTVTVTSNNFGSNLRFSATGLPTGTTISPGLPTNIGQDGSGTYTDNNTVSITDGTLDDLAIWRRAITVEEIRAIYRKGLQGANEQEASVGQDLVAYLPFEDDFSDHSGRGHHGLPVGSPTFGAGKVGKAIGPQLGE
jgi:hypothetical protein